VSDVTYRVAIELATTGNLSSQVGQSVSKLDSLSGVLSRVGHEASTLAGSLVGVFEGAIEGAVSLASTLGKLGATAALGSVTYGAVLLNKELESIQIALAAIFGAQHITSSMTEGMSVAAELMKQMRTDAAELPGEFKDLVGIFQLVATPGFQAGQSISEIKTLSAQAMAAAATMRMPMEQAGRELEMLLEGRAGAHNRFGMLLPTALGGEAAERFNKLAPAERFKFVSDQLAALAPAIDEYKKSFDGLSSTLVDNAKRFLGLATTPLFERLKTTLGEANAWFDGNEDKVALWASIVGDRLGAAFDVGKQKLLSWWPAIEAFAEHAYDRIAGIWQRVGPLVESVADRAAKLLGNDKALDRIEQIGLLYAGTRAGGLLSGLMPSVAGLGDLDRLVKATGIAGKVAPEGSAFDAMAGRFRDLVTGQFVAGEAGGLFELLADPVVLAGAAAAAALLVEGLVATAGAMHALADETSSYHDFAVTLWDDIQSRGGEALDALSHVVHTLEPYALELADSMGVQLLEALKLMAIGAEGAARAVERAASLFAKAMDWLGIEPGAEGHQRMPSGRRSDPGALREYSSVIADVLAKQATVKTGAGGGGGGVHVDRVEITVSGNQDPNRVARVIAAHLSDLARYRKSSPYVVNFSASR
jgi:hypothetical protein